MGVRRFIAIGIVASFVLARDARADDGPAPAGVVLVLGDVSGPEALAAARTAGGARWRLETLEAPQHEGPVAPPPVEVLRETYLQADFLRCLTRLQDPTLDFGALVGAGNRRAAAVVAGFGAACAHGAADEALARELLRRALVMELDLRETLAVTSPEVQQLAETVRREIAAQGQVRVRVRTRPSGAALQVDGGLRSCARTPCELALRPGRHLFRVRRLGARPRTASRELSRDGELTLALDPASAPETRRQLAVAFARTRDPSDPRLVPHAATALEARVVAVVWPTDGGAAAAVYDRARDHIVARVRADGQDAVSTAIRNAVTEWRGIAEPKPLYREPWLWLGTVAAAGAAALVMYFVFRPADTRHDLVVGP